MAVSRPLPSLSSQTPLGKMRRAFKALSRTNNFLSVCSPGRVILFCTLLAPPSPVSSWSNLPEGCGRTLQQAAREIILTLSVSTLPFFASGSYEQEKNVPVLSNSYCASKINSRRSLHYIIFKTLVSGAKFPSLWNLMNH